MPRDGDQLHSRPTTDMIRPACQTRQHGIAASRKGCTCDICNEAKREHNSRPRIRSYRRRDRREGDVMCVSCCCWFHPKGVTKHEDACHG